MPQFLLYRDGQIVGTGVAEQMQHLEGYGVQALRWDLPLPVRLDHYRIVDGEVVARDVMAPSVSATSIAADGEDACVIAGLPDPCTVAISGAVTAGPVDVVGGELVLTSTVPGAIHVRVTAGVQWRPWEVTIDAA